MMKRNNNYIPEQYQVLYVYSNDTIGFWWINDQQIEANASSIPCAYSHNFAFQHNKYPFDNWAHTNQYYGLNSSSNNVNWMSLNGISAGYPTLIGTDIDGGSFYFVNNYPSDNKLIVFKDSGLVWPNETYQTYYYLTNNGIYTSSRQKFKESIKYKNINDDKKLSYYNRLMNIKLCTWIKNTKTFEHILNLSEDDYIKQEKNKFDNIKKNNKNQQLKEDFNEKEIRKQYQSIYHKQYFINHGVVIEDIETNNDLKSMFANKKYHQDFKCNIEDCEYCEKDKFENIPQISQIEEYIILFLQDYITNVYQPKINELENRLKKLEDLLLNKL